MDGITVFLGFFCIHFKDDNAVVFAEFFRKLMFDILSDIIHKSFGVIEFVNRILQSDAAILHQHFGKLSTKFSIFYVVTDDEHDGYNLKDGNADSLKLFLINCR